MSTDASNDASAAVSRDELPNARVRLRLHFHASSLPERDIEQTIWLRGSKFRVRDEVGRELYEMLGDVTYPRGLGLPATTMEEIMDRNDAARRKPTGVTDVYGDLATGAGWVGQTGEKPSPVPASKLAPLARQVLAAGDDPRLTAVARAGDVKRLGRAAVEYKGDVEVDEKGAKRRNAVVRVVAPPYLLLDDVRNAELADHYYVREVVALDEGVVTDADVTPPSAPSPVPAP
ncbi:MAG TPA: hypothetical protein VM261_28975 [Kofleriaceae bacterium]|nr:hypothetical protein [Kofleriaceae bacterium]